MNKEYSFKKLNKTFLITTLFLVGIAFFIPNYVIGAKKIELTAKPTGKNINLSWETQTAKVDEFIVTRITEDEKKMFYVKGSKNQYIDSQVEQRKAYSYKVTAKSRGKVIEESEFIENVILSQADNPHGMYGDATALCSTCHANKEDVEDQTDSMAQTMLCFSCHGDIEKHFNDVTISGSMHPIMSQDTELKCTDCHNPHKTADENNPNILKLSFKLKDDSVLKLSEINDDFCFACHSDGGKSSKLINKELYQTNSLHNKPIVMSESDQGSKISCYNCHTTHSSEYKSLLKFQFDSFSKKIDVKNNELCFSCHGQESKINILSLYNGNDDGVNKGHYIKDKELAKEIGLPVGWKLSCADCHSTHGSKNNKAISDKLGDFKSIKDPIKKERAICTSCHAYSNGGSQKSIFRGVFFSALPSNVDQHSVNPTGDLKSCSSCHGNNNTVLGAHVPKGSVQQPKESEESKADDSVNPKGSTDGVSTPPKDSEPTDEPNRNEPSQNASNNEGQSSESTTND